MIQRQDLSNLFGSTKQGEERKHKNLKLFLLQPHGAVGPGEIHLQGQQPLHKPKPPSVVPR